MIPTRQDDRPRIEDDRNTPEKVTRNEGEHHPHKLTRADFLEDLRRATRRLDEQSDPEGSETAA